MHCTLRPWQLSDLDNLVQYANNPRIAQNLMDRFPHPYTKETGQQFLAMAMQGTPPNVLCIDYEGHAIGGIGLHFREDIERFNAELGYWLAEPFWGNGISTKAVMQMVDYGFSHWPVTRIFARPFGSNAASKKVLTKAGFTLEARFKSTFYKNGQFEDEWVYAIRRPEA